MKKLLLVAVGLFVAFIAMAFVAFQIFAAPQLKTIIEQKGSESLGGVVRLQGLSLSLIPIGVHATGITAQSQTMGLKAEIHSARVTIWPKGFSALQTAVIIQKPNIQLDLSAQSASTPSPQAPTGQPESAPAVPSVPTAVQFRIEGGQVQAIQKENSVALKNLNLNLDWPSMNQPLTMSSQTQVGLDWAGIQWEFPVRASSTLEIQFDKSVVKVNQSQMDLAGLATSATGWMQWTSQKQSWNISVDVPSLSQLKVPPAFLPPGQWSGAISGSAQIQKATRWIAQGRFSLKDLKGQVQMRKQDLALDGPLSASAETEFTYDQTLSIKKLVSSAQLTGLAIKYKDLFTKPSQTPLEFEIDSSMQNDVLQVRKLRFVLAQLLANGSGELAYKPGAQSVFQFEIPQTSLAGFEKLLPPLSEFPVQGVIQASASLRGDIQDPMKMNIRLNPLRLENIRAHVNWKNLDGSLIVKGPMAATMRALIVADGPQLRSSDVTARADLNGLSISMKDKFEKPSGTLFELNIKAAQARDKISIQQGALKMVPGTIQISGDVQNPQAPKLNLKTKVISLDLAKLSQMVPMLKVWKLSGTSRGQLSITGTYDFKKGYEKSPLFVTGDLSANLPQFTYTPNKSEAAGAGTSGKAAATPPPEPMLPDWPVARQADIKSSVQIGLVRYGDLPIRNLNWQGRLNKGLLSGSVSIGDVFSGSVQIQDLSMNLAQAAPTLTCSIRVSSLQIGSALDWMFPSYNGLASGLASGNVRISAAHSSRPDFIETTTAQGEMTLKNGFLSTLKFDQAVNEKLSKIPGLGGKTNLSTKGATGDIFGKFALLKGTLNFETLNVKTPEKNELTASGWMKIDKSLDMKGTVYLVNPAVGGDVVAANSDSQGRFMLPVRITGSAFDPQFNLTDETIQTLLTRTAKYSGEKFKKEAEAKAKEAAQKEIDKGKKELEERIKKGIKGILGQ